MYNLKQQVDVLIYFILFGSTLFINKYVLSVLNFTYPTIFQGWQTLIGGVLMKLVANKCLATSTTALDKPGFVSLLPSFLFFAAGLVAFAKALANLTIPVFLCLYNILSATLYLLEVIPPFHRGVSLVSLGAAVVVIGTAMVTIVIDMDMMFSDSPYFWMLVFLACSSVQSLHSKIADARYTEIDRLYFSYIFSVVVLAPASFYLEEAFDVLRFPHASRYDFYAGCLLSGVFGLFLNLSIMKVQEQPHFGILSGTGKLVTAALALVAFPNQVPASSTVQILVALNLVSATLVPHVMVVGRGEGGLGQTESFSIDIGKRRELV